MPAFEHVLETRSRGEPILLMGWTLEEVLIGIEGTSHVFRRGLEPITLEAPFVLDRWILDSTGCSRADVVAHTNVTVAVVPFEQWAKALGAMPALRRLSANQRFAIMGSGPAAYSARLSM